METSAILNWVIALVSPLLATFPYNKKCVRAVWTKPLFIILAVVGFLVGMAQVSLDAGWLTFSSDVTRGLNGALSHARGFMLGSLFALLVSGELFRRDQTDQKVEDRPTSQPQQQRP